VKTEKESREMGEEFERRRRNNKMFSSSFLAAGRAKCLRFVTENDRSRDDINNKR